MAATNKVGTQLLVSPHMLDRARALAIVRHERVAEIWRVGLEGGGLPEMEKRHKIELAGLEDKIHEAMKADGETRSRSKILEIWARHGMPA